jgi:hypothetical protein
MQDYDAMQCGRARTEPNIVNGFIKQCGDSFQSPSRFGMKMCLLDQYYQRNLSIRETR